MTVQCWERYCHTRGKKEQGTGENCVSDRLHDLHCSPNIIWVITPRNIMDAACVKWILLRLDDKDRNNMVQGSGQVVGPCEQNDDRMGSKNLRNFLTSWETIHFSRKISALLSKQTATWHGWDMVGAQCCLCALAQHNSVAHGHSRQHTVACVH